MTNTKTRTRLRATNRRIMAHAPAEYARVAAKSLRRNYGTVATKAGRTYRRAQRAIRQHPGTSIAIMVVGIGLVAGMLLGLATRSRWLPQRPMAFWPS